MNKLVCFVMLLLCCELNPMFAQASNNALRFDGIDDYVNLNALVPFLAASPDFTIEFWVKTDFNKNTVQPRVNFIAINPAAPVENKFAIIMGEPGNTQSGRLSIFEAFGNTKYLTSPGLVGDQNCHHVAYVRSGMLGEGFLDGVSFGTIDVGAAITADDRASIGQDWDNLTPSDFYSGDFEDLRIWNVARTAAEINANMNAKFTGTEPGLLAYYRFNQGIGDGNNTGLDLLEDGTGNNFDGVLVNFDLTGSTSNWTKANFAPEINLGSDSILCTGNTLILSGPEALAYNWSTGSSSRDISVSEAGTIWLEVNNGSCSSRDTILIEMQSLPESAVHEHTFCKGTNIVLGVFSPNVNTYLWSTESTESAITVEASGLYTVKCSNECGSAQQSFVVAEDECACYIYAPNTFTPNNDPINPTFKVEYDCPIETFNMTIYNRWGELVFESADPDVGWEGKYKNTEVPLGLYSYKFEYKSVLMEEPKKLKGHVLLTK